MMAVLSAGTAMMARGVRWRTLTMLAITLGGALALSACGGDEETQDAAAAPAPNSPTGGNRAPTLVGTPSTAIVQSQAYNFAPTARDPDGNALTFTIANRPPWATFNAATGALTGTPGPGDVGTYSNIRITVSDGTASASTGTFSIQVVAVAAGSATLSWVPPTQNTDGSPLSLTGYHVYWGPAEGNYPNSVMLNNPGLSAYVVENLVAGRWFFTVTAVSSLGVESAFSNVGQKTL